MFSGPSGVVAPVGIPEVTIVYFILAVCSATVFLYATCTASIGSASAFCVSPAFAFSRPADESSSSSSSSPPQATSIPTRQNEQECESQKLPRPWTHLSFSQHPARNGQT